MLTSIEKLFEKKYIKRNGLLLLIANDAISFLKTCQNLNVKILGIDAFKIDGFGTIQPLMEKSIDFSLEKSSGDIYIRSIELISKNQELYYEIIT